MTDETKVILKHYFLLLKSGCDEQLVLEFAQLLCAAKDDTRDSFVDALSISLVLAEIATEPQKQRAPRRDKGVPRGPKPVSAVA